MRKLIAMTTVVMSLMVSTLQAAPVANFRPEIAPKLEAKYTNVNNLKVVFDSRFAADANGVKKFPIRYLPNFYDANYYKVDGFSNNNDYLYEVVDGQPVFYMATRYEKPVTFESLQSLPSSTESAHKLNTSTTGLNLKGTVGNLKLN